jgi:signal transduction histidine kinase
MALGAAPGLTKIGFRRDVRTFLTVLVVFFTVVILILLIVLQQFWRMTEEASTARWGAIADAVTAEVEAMEPAAIEIRLPILRQRYGIEQVELGSRRFGQDSALPPPDHQLRLERQTRHGPVRFVFGDSELRALRRRFTLTASISVAATAVGVLLLFLYLPRITRPVEAMLDEARQVRPPIGDQDEANYLIDTFRDTIARLGEHEAELKRLHEMEKTRADELELVSATLTRSLTSGLIALDATGRVVRLNPAACETLGVPPEVAGKPLAEALGDHPLVRTLESAIAKRESLSRVEVRHRELTIGLTAVPVIGERGAFVGTLVLLTDLTPIMALEGRVRAMETLADLGEMSAGIAHEFRNSLSTILGNLRLVGRSQNEEEASRRLRAAETEALQLSSAVERLLGFAKPVSLALEDVELGELVAGVVERLRETAPEIEFTIDGQATIEGDPALLARAVENVVRNSIDAIRERDSGTPQNGGRISITLRDKPPEIVVEDNGAGLDPSNASRLLLPFQSNKPGGFGLGLSLARKIVILHRGEITLTGRAGEGAAVTMRFMA